MSAQTRVSGIDLYHHVYAWGNDRHPIFKEIKHYQAYLNLLSKHSKFFKVDVIAYALMEWHVHLFVHDRNNKLSRFMQRIHGDYARYYNHRALRTGHVFGERYNNKIVQCNDYGIRLSKYINLQAVKAKIVNHPEDYPWTSYGVYAGCVKDSFVRPDVILHQFGMGDEAYQRYNEYLHAVENDPTDWGNRSFMIIGNDDFIENYKKKLGGQSSGGGVSRKVKLSIYRIVQKEMKQDMRVLLKPKGIVHRRKRREVFRILVNKYGYTRTAVADTFHISVMGVSKAVRK